MIPKSTEYCAIRRNVIIARGSAKLMRRLVKAAGGYRAGFSVGIGGGAVGDTFHKNRPADHKNRPADSDEAEINAKLCF